MLTETELYDRYEELKKENDQLKKDIQSLALRSSSIFKENEKLNNEIMRLETTLQNCKC